MNYMLAPQELDYVIGDFRNHPSGFDFNKGLGYMNHYYPNVKVGKNLGLLMSAFLNSTVCLDGSKSLQSLYSVCDLFSLLTEKKLKVSVPTLPLKEWYEITYKELYNFFHHNKKANCWKVIPILTGILLCSGLRDELYTDRDPIRYHFFHRIDNQVRDLLADALNATFLCIKSPHIVHLAMLCLATLTKTEHNYSRYKLNATREFLISSLIDMYVNQSYGVPSIFMNDLAVRLSDNGSPSNISSYPVFRNLSKISSLIESLICESTTDAHGLSLIAEILTILTRFNKQLSMKIGSSSLNGPKIRHTTQSQSYLNNLKVMLFSQIIIFQGMIKLYQQSESVNIVRNIFGNASRLFKSRFRDLSFRILENLYYLNFILLEIGTGGFDNYNFVYYSSLEIALKSSPSTIEFENLSKYLIGNYQEVNLHPSVINENYVVRSKVLFVIGIWEYYMQQTHHSEEIVRDYIFPISMQLVDDSKYTDTDLIEGCHSVLLSCFANFRRDDSKFVSDYSALLFKQFPKILSASQLNIGIETLGKKILTRVNAQEEQDVVIVDFLNNILSICSESPPGIFINSKDSNTLFASAQPIAELDANSSLSLMKNSRNVNVVEQNKAKALNETVASELLKSNEQEEHSAETTVRSVPVTIREAYCVSFIHLLPYIPLSKMDYYVQSIWKIIQSSNSEEFKFLSRIFWKIISENLDFNRANLTYKWWYQSPDGLKKFESLHRI